MQKNQFLKIKNIPLELKKDFVELKDKKLKIIRQIKELFFKSIVVSIGDMDKSEQKEMKKIRTIKNTCHD